MPNSLQLQEGITQFSKIEQIYPKLWIQLLSINYIRKQLFFVLHAYNFIEDFWDPQIVCNK